MNPEDLAALHARCFASPPPWSPAAFAAALADPAVFLLTRAASAPLGAFLVGRAAAGEAELLTLATDPGFRRQGLARALLDAFEAEARARGAMAAFLEVAEDNAPARALYTAQGWAQVGRRPRYYPRPGAAAAAALIFRRTLDHSGGSPG